MAAAGSIQFTGQGAQGFEPVEQQRIVGAGERDRIGARAVLFDEARFDFIGDIGVGDRLAVERRLGQHREAARADQRDARSLARIRG